MKNTLKYLKKLNDLYLSDNVISDISPLAKLTMFRRIFLDNNNIVNIS